MGTPGRSGSAVDVQMVGVPLRGGQASGLAYLESSELASASAAPLPGGPSSPRGYILCADVIRPTLLQAPGGPWAGFVVSSTGGAGLPRTGPPVVGGLEPVLFRPGDPLSIDGGVGRVTLDGVREVRVVTSFLQRSDGRILLLRRSERVGSFRGRWAGVSGFLEDPTPLDQALREIREETGVSADRVELADTGRTVYARDGDRVFAIHPFRFRVAEVTIALDWEHTEFDWVDPDEVRRRETVPRLDRVWEAVAPRRSGSRLPNP